MSNRYSIGEVMCCEDGEILLYDWIELEEAIKAIENCFDEVVQPPKLKKSSVDTGNTFHAETIPMAIQASITRATQKRGAP